MPKTSYRLSGGDMPIGLTPNEHTMLLLDMLKPIYGPGIPQIMTAAVDALYAAVGDGTATTSGERLDQMTVTFRCGNTQMGWLALFWLAATTMAGARAMTDAAKTRQIP